MAVVKEFTLPDLGEGLTEAEIVRWLVEIGEVVAVDQPVVEVETAKAVVEVPCPYGGVVTARFGEEGETLAVGRPLVTVAVGSMDGTEGGAPADEKSAAPGPGGSGPGGTGPGGNGPDDGGAGTAAEEGSGNVLVGYGTGPAARRRNRVRTIGRGTMHTGAATGHGGAAASVPPHDALPPRTAPAVNGHRADDRSAGPAQGQDNGRADARAGHLADGGPVAVVSPLVRRLARERGLDLRTVAGSGPDGLILRADVERAAAPGTDGATASAQAPDRDLNRSYPNANARAHAQDPTPGPTPVPVAAPVSAGSSMTRDQEGAERIPLRGIRGAVAAKLTRSRREIPDATCWVDADATELLAVRTAMNAAAQAAGAERISVLAVLARITTAALARHPDLNATVDTERGEIVRLPAVHLGFAAQTERGLVVPVVRDAQARTTAGLSAEIGRLTQAARDSSLTPGELTGGTFTLNNYGVFGVDGSTPIINHPEAAMLGIGRIVPKPWVHQGELAVRQVVQLSFTFDHRVCDGGTAGGFLRFVADCVENPAVLLASV
ncbi:pyruvate dehydrogenase E2 component (dihydrolipoamide acetyltransferase) [Streptomyces sp. DvalAA-14]|uniref:dihydrolipoamide acetyltransferase family protein n=1 Tax=unclassified Streptomyces TaxID=2593676 RepID=UPI00081B38C6|nr:MULTISPECIES: dihydrolipoamide acetyltransferase family protein [unclassified Streptomyces]MYS18779.1 2-oxo acid dehydrogenase subunit E2 [Streptomyces sp. SID4948]SCD29308.1 pyruvate dehydrogenase E2 component (dihydrolipoamide acetyltransferase) [Streptomyces sp. DvalAA-14]